VLNVTQLKDGSTKTRCGLNYLEIDKELNEENKTK
jgi:hypothetical protein